MTRRAPKDLAASVRRRLLDRARERAEDYQLVLVYYAVERFLYRVSRSPHADRFILKGAMLFSAWEEAPHRPTRDLDLLGYGEEAVSSVEQVVADIVRTDVEPDGLEFEEGSIRGEEIREEQEYRGVRVRLTAHLAGARIPLQVDVAFGDVWALAERMRFEGPRLRGAIEATFRRRRTPVPSDAPVVLTAEFHDDRSKRLPWSAFLGRTGLTAPDLQAIIARLRAFLLPPAPSIARGDPFDLMWPPPGPWQSRP